MIKKLRKAFRQSFGHLMARTVGQEAANQPLDALELRSIVVVRTNGRMGNTLFLTPLLVGIAARLPNASIDVLSLYPEADKLLRGLPGLRRVMILPHKGWWRLNRTIATLRDIRRDRYDLAIDPSPESLGGRLWMMFCRSRWRLGFKGQNQWLSLTHDVEIPGDTAHEALRPLALLQRLPEAGAAPVPRLRLALDTAERQAGADRLETCLDEQVPDRRRDRPVIGFFAHARGNKTLGLDWWRKFWRRFLSLEPDVIPLEVLPSPSAERVLTEGAALHVAATRDLAGTLAGVNLFVSADTGPMHLASTNDTPVIALFGSTDPAKYGPLKPSDSVIPLDDRSAEEIADACWQVARSRLAMAPEPGSSAQDGCGPAALSCPIGPS
jgi:heptosyltransferase-3